MPNCTARVMHPTPASLALLAVMLISSSAMAADWPQFRGPERDNISPDTGLLQQWPKDGPPLLWSSDKIGFGWSSVAIVGQRIYTLGVVANNESVTALDLSGDVKWQQKLEAPSPGGGFKGSRSTPTVDGDHMYVLTSEGGLYCLAIADGSIIWKKHMLREYKAPQIRHSLAESVLVDGNLVICSPGGQSAMVALDKKTGAEVWRAPAIEANASYTSPLLIEYGGMRQVVNVSGNYAFGVDVSDGKLLWKHEHKTPWEVNCNTPIYHDGVVYFVRGYKLGGEALRLHVDAGERTVRVESVWKSTVPDDRMGGALLKDGHIYGAGQDIAGLYCLDWKSGSKIYERKEIGEASLTWADGRLYVQEHAGTIKLVDPADGSVKGQFAQQNRRKELWAYPVVLDGRLYVRNQSQLSVYNVRAEE